MCVIFKEPVNTPEFKTTKKLCFWKMSCNFWAVMFNFLFIINKTFKVIAVLLIKTQQLEPNKLDQKLLIIVL